MTSPMASIMPGARSHIIDLDGPVHYIEVGGPAGAPLLVLVHGLGGSHLDWVAILPELSQHARVMAIDLVGHGLTPRGRRIADVESHRRLVGAFLREVAGTPAILVGNSMGGLVSALQAAREPETVAGLVLVDPALPAGSTGKLNPKVLVSFVLCMIPGFGEWYLPWRWRHSTPEREVRRALAASCFDSSHVPQVAIDAQVELSRQLDRLDVDTAYLQSTRSVCSMMLRPRRPAASLDGIDQPVLLLHGDRDTLVPLAAARRISAGHPDWRFSVARDVGHVPMLEVPGWTVEQITDWITFGGSGAAKAAQRANPIR